MSIAGFNNQIQTWNAIIIIIIIIIIIYYYYYFEHMLKYREFIEKYT